MLNKFFFFFCFLIMSSNRGIVRCCIYSVKTIGLVVAG